MSDKLIRESIAEAKQVKSAAIANARLLIEEAFKPTLANAIAAQLRNEMEDATKGDGYGKEDGGETDKKAVLEKVNPSSSNIGKGDNDEPSSDARSSSNIPNPGQELKKMGEGAEVYDDGHEKVINSLDQEEFKEPLKEADPEIDIDVDDDDQDNEDSDEDDFGSQQPDLGPGAGAGAASIAADDEDEFGGDEGEENLDLDSLIRELERDVLGNDSVGGEHEDEVMATENLTAAGDASGHEVTKDMEPHLGPEGESDILKLSEKKKEEVDEDISLDEILRIVDEEIGNDASDPLHFQHPERFGVDSEKLQSENVDLKRQLKEHRDVIRFLKDRIQEVNMLNAKLLFTNKLFKQFNLNGGQKMHVVETFDRATTLREIKLIYTTLAEAYSVKVDKKKPVSQITEGLASRVTGSTKPKTQLNESVTIEEDEQVKRFQKLAGILKKS